MSEAGAATFNDKIVATELDISGNIDVDGTTNLDVTNIVGDLTATSDTVTFQSANSQDPYVKLINTTNDAVSARLIFIKDKGAAGADGDDIGTITFQGDNDAQELTDFAKIIAEVSDASDGAEGGKIALQVASHDGELATGLLLNDGNLEDEVDVNIASGTSSVTSIAGHVGLNCTPSATDWGSAAPILQLAGIQPLISLKETDVTDKEFQFASSGGAIYFYDSDASATRMLINTNGVIDGDFNDTSDISLKENIKELPSSLDVVNKLNPVSFDWKEDQRPSKGFIAQEVEAVDSTLAGGEEGSKSIKTSGIVAVLTKAVQELAEEVESLKNNKCKCEE
jgi:hypothetical protein